MPGQQMEILAIVLLVGLFWLVVRKVRGTGDSGTSAKVPWSMRNNPSELHKLATKLKREGKLDEAVDVLRKATSVMNNDGVEYTMSRYLRLPLFLQQSGRFDEAWHEFHALLTRASKQHSVRSLRFVETAQVLDKMRLALQREGHKDEAAKYGVMSYLADMKSKYIDKSRHNYKDLREHFTDPDNIGDTVAKLLKHRSDSAIEEMAAHVEQWSQRPNQMQWGEVQAKLNDILELSNNIVNYLPE